MNKPFKRTTQNATAFPSGTKEHGSPGVINDSTSGKLSLDELVESEWTYRQLFNLGALPQCIYDHETLRVVNVNEAALQKFQYSRKEFLKLFITDILEKEEKGKFFNYLQLLQSSNGPVTSIWNHSNKQKEKIVIEVSAAIVVYQKRPCVLATFNDITEKIRLEDRVSKMKVLHQKKITKATIRGQEKEREQLGKELHDNINQILTTIKLYLELAETKEELRSSLIAESRKHVNTVMDEIRSLSKSLMASTLQDFGMEDAIRELIETYHLTNTFEVHYSQTGKLEQVPADMKLTLFRIMQELLNNVVKYARATEVNITMTIGRSIQLTIVDNGIGFNTYSRRKGIGITNIRNRAGAYNGKVKIESAPGKGCFVSVSIPFRSRLHEDKPMHLIIAEDNDEDQELLREAFQEFAPQHRLTFTSNGKKLVDLLQSSPVEDLPSLIILDYSMPVLNGLETLKLLEIDPRLKHIPKIVYSTANNSHYKEQCYSANATAYIEKGATMDDIRENILQMLSFAAT